jgi:hypothetical protein
LEELKTEIDDLAIEIEKNCDLFYEQQNADALEGFLKVISGVTGLMDKAFQYKQEHPDFAFDEKQITETLNEAADALQDTDLVLLADIMQYDFSDILRNMSQTM